MSIRASTCRFAALPQSGPPETVSNVDVWILVDFVAYAVGTAGMGVIVWGSVRALSGFFLAEFRGRHNSDTTGALERLRLGFGAYLLLGLEFMVAADIIHTIARPDFESLIVLGAIVAIRTVISFFLTREMRISDR